MTSLTSNSIGHLYDAIKRRFTAIGLPTPALDARLLICHVLDLSHEEFILQTGRMLSPEQVEGISALVRQRLDRKPIAKILGYKEFYGLRFLTSTKTLDPRPDSETLVDAVLHALPDRGRPYRILDLGTGTGCLLLSLLHALPQASGIGVDMSQAALTLARENALRLELLNCADFIQSDWFDKVTGSFDVIISNPPYIPSGDRDTLPVDVRDYEPEGALYGGADGLDPYRHIIPLLSGFLTDSGFVAFEVGQGQAEEVLRLLKENGFDPVWTQADLNGIDRAILGR